MYRGIHYFLNLFLIHRLWVLVRTASLTEAVLTDFLPGSCQDFVQHPFGTSCPVPARTSCRHQCRTSCMALARTSCRHQFRTSCLVPARSFCQHQFRTSCLVPARTSCRTVPDFLPGSCRSSCQKLFRTSCLVPAKTSCRHQFWTTCLVPARAPCRHLFRTSCLVPARTPFVILTGLSIAQFSPPALSFFSSQLSAFFHPFFLGIFTQSEIRKENTIFK